MSSVVLGRMTTCGTSRYGLASEAYRTRSIALWRTFSFPRRAMRSDFKLPGVPSTREAGTASLVGGPSNRPMCAGFAENSFLIIAAPSYDRGKSYGGAAGRYIPRIEGKRGGLRLLLRLRSVEIDGVHCQAAVYAEERTERRVNAC